MSTCNSAPCEGTEFHVKDNHPNKYSVQCSTLQLLLLDAELPTLGSPLGHSYKGAGSLEWFQSPI